MTYIPQPDHLVADDNALDLAVLAADAGLAPGTAWAYLNHALVTFDGLPAAVLYAVRVRRAWRVVGEAELRRHLPTRLCAYVSLP